MACSIITLIKCCLNKSAYHTSWNWRNLTLRDKHSQIWRAPLATDMTVSVHNLQLQHLQTCAMPYPGNDHNEYFEKMHCRSISNSGFAMQLVHLHILMINWSAMVGAISSSSAWLEWTWCDMWHHELSINMTSCGELQAMCNHCGWIPHLWLVPNVNDVQCSEHILNKL